MRLSAVNRYLREELMSKATPDFQPLKGKSCTKSDNKIVAETMESIRSVETMDVGYL